MPLKEAHKTRVDYDLLDPRKGSDPDYYEYNGVAFKGYGPVTASLVEQILLLR